MNPNKNECGKMRKIDKPYEIWVTPDFSWQWFVLRKYQAPKHEANNNYARWMCAVRSPMTQGGWDYGDTYVSEIKHEAFQLIGVLDLGSGTKLCFECSDNVKPSTPDGRVLFVHNKVESGVQNVEEIKCECCGKSLIDVPFPADILSTLERMM